MSDVWRLTFKSVRGSLLIQQTFHLAVDAYIGGTDPNGKKVADMVASKMALTYRGLLDVGSTLQSVDSREEVLPPAIPGSGSSVTSAGVGSRTTADTLLATPLCGLITMHTDSAVRGGVGRTFGPPVIVSAALGANGTIPAGGTYGSPLAGFATVLSNGIESGSWWTGGWVGKLIVYSRTRHKRGDPNYWFTVTSCVAKTDQHWLRSRIR